MSDSTPPVSATPTQPSLAALVLGKLNTATIIGLAFCGTIIYAVNKISVAPVATPSIPSAVSGITKVQADRLAFMYERMANWLEKDVGRPQINNEQPVIDTVIKWTIYQNDALQGMQEIWPETQGISSVSAPIGVRLNALVGTEGYAPLAPKKAALIAELRTIATELRK